MKRRRAALEIDVDLFGGSAATVEFRPARGRWPNAEALDRLTLPVSLAAVTLGGVARSLRPRVRLSVLETAVSLMEPCPPEGCPVAWAETVARRRFVSRAGPGQPRIALRLVESRDGASVTVKGRPPSPLTMAASTAVVAGAALKDTAADLQLASGLAIEWLLQWFRENGEPPADARLTARDALGHALQRLDQAGRPVPEALEVAVARRR